MLCFCLWVVCLCAADLRVPLCLIKTSFKNLINVRESGGILVDLHKTSVFISQMSIVSKVKQGMALIRGIESAVAVSETRLDGLENGFAHITSGSLAVTSSSFSNSERPITLDTYSHQPATTSQCQRVYYGWGSLSLVDRLFDGCTGDSYRDSPGGAVYFEDRYSLGSITLSIIRCNFINCWSGDRWGDAVYSTADISSIVLDDCIFEHYVDSLSVFHAQCGYPPVGTFGALCFTNNTFRDINVGDNGHEGGGSGLVVRYPSSLELVMCSFERCISSRLDGGALLFEFYHNEVPSFTFEGCIFRETKALTNGGAISLPNECEKVVITGCLFQDNDDTAYQTGFGGFLHFGANLGQLIIRDTTFQSSSANDGRCIYTEEQVSGFTIDNVTVDACSARNGRSSIVVNTEENIIDGLHLLNMLDGQGRLMLYVTGPSKKVSFSNCSFRNFSTYEIVSTTRSFRSGIEGLAFTNCCFEDVDSLGDNLFLHPGNLAPNVSCLFTNCTFRKISAEWALLNVQSGQDVSFSMTECTFDDLKIVQRYRVEPFFMFRSSNLELLITHTVFNNNVLSNGILKTSGYGSDARICLDNLRFEDCIIERATRYEWDECSFLDIRGPVETLKLSNCFFIHCNDSKMSLLSITTVPDVNISCSFVGCTCPTHLLSVTDSNQFAFHNCSVRDMSLGASPVSVGTQVNDVTFEDVVFSGLSGDQLSLISFAQNPATSQFQRLVIEECTFSTLGTLGSSTTSLINGKFIQNHITNNFIMASGATSHAVELVCCEFECSESGLPLIKLSNTNNVTISETMFRGCSCRSGSLIQLTNIDTVYISGSCFEGSIG